MPARRRDPVSVPRTFHSRPLHHSHDYAIDESISRAGFFSNAILEDTDAAAAHSRSKDYDLLRNTQSAIRHPSPDLGSPRVSRPLTRYQSLPPVDRKSSSTSGSSLSAASRLQSMRSALETPSPTSLLSTKINTFLRGNSTPLGVRPSTQSLVSCKSYLDSATPLPPPPPPKHDSMSIVSYKSHLSDPAVTSPFSTRSSSRLYRGFVPSTSSSLPPYTLRSNSASSSGLPRYNISLNDDQDEDYDYGGSDDYDDEEEYESPSYRRKYKILHGRQALPSRPSSTLYYRSGSPTGSDDDDYDDYSLVSEDRGMYSYNNPRPSGLSSLTLSSYEGPHDGSYEADMADMYDYVPFGPSRQGILELTQHRPSSTIRVIDSEDDDDDDVDSYSPSSHPSPYSSTLLTIPSASPSLSSYSSPDIPSVSLYPKPSSDLTSSSYSPVSSFANNVLFDSVLSSTAARARAALRDCQHLSDYGNASLVMSVEGSAVSADGSNRYGFRYYPPPIPLKGSGVGLDERILGVVPKPSSSPADSFFSDYLNRLKSLRSEINDREESRATGAISSYGRSALSVPRPVPSYAHSTVHMPLHIAGRSHSVPVSSYRSPADDRGLSHRVDVFPLLQSETTLGKDKIQLPMYRSGGDTNQLTMLEKINIKTATEMHSSPRAAVASRKARASSVPPKVQERPMRLHQQLVNRPKVAPSIVFVSTPSVAYPNIARHASTPVAQPNEAPWRIRASSVQPDSRVRRAGSVPPRPLSFHQGMYDPEPQQTLGTEDLRAHKRPPVVMRRSRAGSVPPPRPQSFHVSENFPPPRLVRAGSMQSLRSRGYQPMDEKAIGTEGLRASKLPALSRMSRAQSLTRLPRRRPLDFGVDEVELDRNLNKSKNKSDNKRPVRGFASRAASEPPQFIAPSSAYPPISDAPETTRRRQLFVRRGQVIPNVPSRSVQVYPSYVPTSLAKAAIIGSKMEEGGKAKRKPRPLYHVDKSREPSAGSSQQSAIYYGGALQSGGLQSSRPPLPKPTDRKAIRTVDGFTKPKNVMSWEHRLESRVSPDDLIYQPQSLSRLKEQVLGAHEKLDRHRQLIDRYKDNSINDKTSNNSSSPSSSVKIPDYYYAGADPNNAPMSETRRRLRRTLAKTKNNP